MELADIEDLKSSARDSVRVQIPSRTLFKKECTMNKLICFFFGHKVDKEVWGCLRCNDIYDGGFKDWWTNYGLVVLCILTIAYLLSVLVYVLIEAFK
jgi:hypothetical protein